MQYIPSDNRQYTTVTTAPMVVSPEVVKAPPEIQSDGCNVVHGAERTGKINVLLVDDHTLIREGLSQLLTFEQDIHIVGEAGNGLDALRKIRQLQPDVVLMDIHMPIMDGIAVTQQITREHPSVAVIMLTMYYQHSQVLRAMKQGARGYLLKNSSVKDVVKAIRTVYEGNVYLEPSMAGVIVEELQRLSIVAVDGQNTEMLSEKEIEIIRYVATGMSNREVAQQLAYSEKTVKNYLSTIYQKLHLRDRTQVAIFALRQGLLPEKEL